MTLHEGNAYTEDIRKDLIKTVREQIGAFAAPDVIHWAPGQPPMPSCRALTGVLPGVLIY